MATRKDSKNQERRHVKEQGGIVHLGSGNLPGGKDDCSSRNFYRAELKITDADCYRMSTKAFFRTLQRGRLNGQLAYWVIEFKHRRTIWIMSATQTVHSLNLIEYNKKTINFCLSDLLLLPQQAPLIEYHVLNPTNGRKEGIVIFWKEDTHGISQQRVP